MAVEVKKVGIPLPDGQEVQVTLTKDGSRWKIDQIKAPMAPDGVVIKSGGVYVGIVNPGTSEGKGQVVGTFWRLDGDKFRSVDPDTDRAVQGLARSIAKDLKRSKGPSQNQSTPRNDPDSTGLATDSLSHHQDTKLTLKGPVTLIGSPVSIWELTARSKPGEVVLRFTDGSLNGEVLFFVHEDGDQGFSEMRLNLGNQNLELTYAQQLEGSGLGIQYIHGEKGNFFYLFEAHDGTMVLTDAQNLKGLVNVQKYAPRVEELKYAHLLSIETDAKLGRVQVWRALAENFVPRAWPPSDCATSVFANLGHQAYEIPVSKSNEGWVLSQTHGNYEGRPFFVPNPNQNLAVFVGPEGPFPVLMEPKNRNLTYADRITPSGFQCGYNRHFQKPYDVVHKNLFAQDQHNLLNAQDSRDFNALAGQIGGRVRIRIAEALAHAQSRWLPQDFRLTGQLTPHSDTVVATNTDHPGFVARVELQNAQSGRGFVQRVPVNGPDGLKAVLLPNERLDQTPFRYGFVVEAGDGRPFYVGLTNAKSRIVSVTSDVDTATGTPGLLKRLIGEEHGFTTLTHQAHVEYCQNTGVKPLSAKSSGLHGGMTVAMGTGFGYESILQGLEKISGRHFSQNVHQDWAQLPIGLASALFASHYSGGKVSFRNGFSGFVRGNILANPLMELTGLGFQSLFGGSALASAANFGLGFWLNRATDFIIDNSPYKKLFTTLGYLSMAASLVIDESTMDSLSSFKSLNLSQTNQKILNTIV